MIGQSRNLRCTLRALHREERGAALVEFALVLPIVLLLVLGALDFGKAYNYWIDTTQLSASGARWAAVDRNPGPGASLQETIRGQAATDELRDGTGSVVDPLQVCIAFPDGAEAGERVVVTVTANYHFLNFIGDRIDFTERPISNTATMRLETTPANVEEGCDPEV